MLKNIEVSQTVCYLEGLRRLEAWLEDYSGRKPVSIVSNGKTLDLVLLFELWHLNFPERKYFHNLFCLPGYLNHGAHFDLPTIFWLAGLPPDLDLEALLGRTVSWDRHNAVYDARLVRECFRKCVTRENFPRIFRGDV